MGGTETKTARLRRKTNLWKLDKSVVIRGFYVFVFDSIGLTIIGMLKSVFLPRNLWVCEGELHGVYVVVEDGAFHSAVGGYELLVDVSENHLHLCH